MDVEDSKFITLLTRVEAILHDSSGYTTYIFKNIDDKASFLYKYVMCTRYPNWEHRGLKIGEEGFLTYQPVNEGIDKWFDGYNLVPYKFSANRFINFISKPNEKIIDNKYIMQMRYLRYVKIIKKTWEFQAKN